MKKLWPLAFLIVFAAGCGDDQRPAHTATEQKALDDYNHMTPEQRIAAIEKGQMPQAAKDTMIQKIKQENGMK